MSGERQWFRLVEYRMNLDAKVGDLESAMVRYDVLAALESDSIESAQEWANRHWRKRNVVAERATDLEREATG